MVTGIIKFFNEDKGYGFITNSTTGKDIFLHAKNIDRNAVLEKGNKVEYDEKQGKQGTEAINVRLTE